MRRKTRHRDDQAQINITPMLDVVFIMLIFFIVTTSFAKEDAIDVNRPSSAPPKVEVRSDIIAVRIDPDGRIEIDDRFVDVRSVRANIKAALAGKPDAGVVVIADRRAEAGLLVRVIDQAREANARKVSLAAPRDHGAW